MVASATILRETIRDLWNLSGELSKVSTGTGATFLYDLATQSWVKGAPATLTSEDKTPVWTRTGHLSMLTEL